MSKSDWIICHLGLIWNIAKSQVRHLLDLEGGLSVLSLTNKARARINKGQALKKDHLLGASAAASTQSSMASEMRMKKSKPRLASPLSLVLFDLDPLRDWKLAMKATQPSLVRVDGSGLGPACFFTAVYCRWENGSAQ